MSASQRATQSLLSMTSSSRLVPSTSQASARPQQLLLGAAVRQSDTIGLHSRILSRRTYASLSSREALRSYSSRPAPALGPVSTLWIVQRLHRHAFCSSAAQRRDDHRSRSTDPEQALSEASSVKAHRIAETQRNQQQQQQQGAARDKIGGADPSAGGSSGQEGGNGGGGIFRALVLVGIKARRDYLVSVDPDQTNDTPGRVVDENGHIVRMHGPWTVYVIGALPLNAISRAWGWANNLTLPVWFRPYGFRLYSWIFGCNLDEMKDEDLTHYRSLGEFFSRELKEGARPIAEGLLVSPADGKVLHFGTIKGRRVEQVKGITYSLDALLGFSTDPQSTASWQPNSGDEHGEHIDEKQFANLNGIEYSLERLLGDTSPKRKRGWRKLFSATWWKSWVSSNTPYSRPPTESQHSSGAVTLTDVVRRNSPLPASAHPHAKDSTMQVQSHPSDAEEEEDEDAGVPTPDTPEIIGKYANVAYEMGSGALPPMLQSDSPAHRDLRDGNKLFFAVVYLAPGDYHRFHSPTNWVVERRRHFRGELYSVSPYMASRLSNLFVLNERVALLGRWRHGFFGMVPVGATNVGSIIINFDKSLRTNLRDRQKLAGTYSEASYKAASLLLGGQPLRAGEEMGGFLLGSTIVLVFEAPENFRFTLQPGQKIKVGEKMGDVQSSPASSA
ncbi:phosphatidylserine decarboxylase 1 [Tilletia horrida]|nr:phosphatidylserine decarboxylase 1 [Tilletia horrida]